jgi:hypothetical protein
MAREAGLKPEKLAPTLLIALLIFIGIVAVLEQGPPLVLIYSGASPYNSGDLGTSKLYNAISELYPNTFEVRDWQRFLSNAPECREAVVIIISPEYSYSDTEARGISDFLYSCDISGLVVADESGNANSIIFSIGAGVEIEDSRILDPFTLLPYQLAIFNSRWFSGEVILDLSASLAISSDGLDIIGVVPSGIIAYRNLGPGEPTSNIPVAVTGRVNDVGLLIVSDGSIFLNQAFDFGVWGLILGFINDTCTDSGCMIIFDGSKFDPIDPLSYLEDPETVDVSAIFTPTFLASLITRLVHPATWLPPAIEWVNNIIINQILFDQSIVMLITIISAIILGSIIISRSPVSVRDTRIEDVVERDPLALESLMRSIARKEFKATKNDFKRFYEMLDQIVTSIVGTGLKDENLIDILVSRGVSRDLAERFIRNINRLYRRSMRRFGLPLIVNWTKELVKFSQMAIDILEALGARKI